MRSLLSTLVIFLVASSTGASEANEALARADAAWARRSEGHSGALASTVPIDEAVGAFEEALAQEPENLAIRAQLLKALWFKGEHTGLDRDSKIAVFQQARDLAQEAIDNLLSDLRIDRGRPTTDDIVVHLGDTDHAAEVYFWGAAHWGLWGRYRGKIASARQGVAGKIRDYAEVVIALDEHVEGAGGRRIMGRLHTEAPRLPFITGWIDRKEAIRQLEQAVELAPDDLLNRLYYLEALIDFDSERRSRAVEDLRAMVDMEPTVETVVEDLKILGDARELLERVDR